MKGTGRKYSNRQILDALEQIILKLNEGNIDSSAQETMNLFDTNQPYSFNVVICRLITVAFASQRKNANIYLDYLKSVQSKEEEANINTPKIIEIFVQYLLRNETQESYYLLEKMIEQNLIDSSITKNILRTNYFAHYKTIKEVKDYGYRGHFYDKFLENIKELSKNNWELHKRLVREGINPSDIAKAIRSDDVEKLQEISFRNNFDFNQTIEPSLYEKYSFINEKMFL